MIRECARCHGLPKLTPRIEIPHRDKQIGMEFACTVLTYGPKGLKIGEVVDFGSHTVKFPTGF